ncbi:MAG TPA: radical SAM/SPASM domain-containing protein [Chitinispirillaceae bacterium]|nr:radical SAM/SPASM domain-containing protein [Chitinispirillaceae bacterium]
MILEGIFGVVKLLLPPKLKRIFSKIFPKKHLHKFLPSEYPLTIHIDPSNICNFKCVFCPTSDANLLKEVNREACLMKPELFRKIIDDFSEMLKKKNGRIFCIHLYKDGEPLLNPDFFEMVRYAKNSGIARVLSTTTNGSLITGELAEGLVTCGLDSVRISIEHVNNEGYKNICKSNITYDEILGKVRLLNDVKRRYGSPLYITVKITDTGFKKAELKKFRDDFGPFCDETRVDSLMGWSDSSRKDFTLGKNPETGMDGSTILHKQIVCPDPFSKLSVNSNGTVSVCCVDWSHGIITGNVCNNSIEEIWSGEKYREIRRLHISGNRDKIAVCKSCQYVNGTPASADLDSYREKLLQYYC